MQVRPVTISGVKGLALLFLFTAAPEVFRRGLALLDGGRATEALPLLERATTLDSRNALYWKALGVAYAKLGDYRGAIEPFGKACVLDRDLMDACYYYGRTLYASDRYRDALAPLEAALRVDKDKARAEAALGQCHEALGDYEKAERLFRAAVARRQDPSINAARLAYGRFLVRQGRPSEAVAILKLAQSPETAESRYEIGLALFQAERLQEAVGELQRALSLQPDHEAARLLLDRTRRRLSGAK